MNRTAIRKAQANRRRLDNIIEASQPAHIGQKIINLLSIKQQEVEKQLRHFSSYQDQKTLERLKDSLARSIDDLRRSIS